MTKEAQGNGILFITMGKFFFYLPHLILYKIHVQVSANQGVTVQGQCPRSWGLRVFLRSPMPIILLAWNLKYQHGKYINTMGNLKNTD